ncbi:MAG: helix-turn-helix domain-containing protein [Thalassospira sp.]|uniref:MerR family transcriptional regulator n=1 Tax=Thalassospira TaxID=168934 RepID=UPI0002872D19|nr:MULTISPECIES: helix-turn-helix domain-containing protein [Thalassospira]EKF07937.1 putative heavy metal transcriptional regulator [Thalassospira profundimaris WP0211]MBO6824482.1 helix-turn-helix domain-containing protein [Pseudomonadales bacterium]MBO6842620.1 helix-turn-helix domain-containing protein [Thalassospira sp.]
MNGHVSVKGLKRAKLAERTGCNLETIRYYEKIGLMPDPPRTSSGYRVYDDTHAERLGFILRGRQLGFSIDELRGLLLLVDRGTQTCADVKVLTEKHLVDVRAKIEDLRRIEKVLAATAAQCSGERVPECPVLEALGS